MPLILFKFVETSSQKLSLGRYNLTFKEYFSKKYYVVADAGLFYISIVFLFNELENDFNVNRIELASSDWKACMLTAWPPRRLKFTTPAQDRAEGSILLVTFLYDLGPYNFYF